MLASVSWGQTGNGVILLTDASYAFTPTTVDSGDVQPVRPKRRGHCPDRVLRRARPAFSLSSTAPVEIAGDSSLDFSITFTPSAIGLFTDTLEVIGDVFGSASLIVSGDGIQVQLSGRPTRRLTPRPLAKPTAKPRALQRGRWRSGHQLD